MPQAPRPNAPTPARAAQYTERLSSDLCTRRPCRRHPADARGVGGLRGLGGAATGRRQARPHNHQTTAYGTADSWGSAGRRATADAPLERPAGSVLDGVARRRLPRELAPSCMVAVCKRRRGLLLCQLWVALLGRTWLGGRSLACWLTRRSASVSPASEQVVNSRCHIHGLVRSELLHERLRGEEHGAGKARVRDNPTVGSPPVLRIQVCVPCGCPPVPPPLGRNARACRYLCRAMRAPLGPPPLGSLSHSDFVDVAKWKSIRDGHSGLSIHGPLSARALCNFVRDWCSVALR